MRDQAPSPHRASAAARSKYSCWLAVKLYPTSPASKLCNDTEQPFKVRLVAASVLLFSTGTEMDNGAAQRRRGATPTRQSHASSIRSAALMRNRFVPRRVEGKQYVAVPTGWGGWLKGFAINTFGSSRGSALVVSALP